MYAEELEALDPLPCGPVNVDRGLLSLLSHVGHYQLLRFVDVEGEVFFLAPLCQGPHLLVIVLSLFEIRSTTVVSSANLMIELEACVATQSWVNSEYRRGLSTYH
jgi:hypothetical protein